MAETKRTPDEIERDRADIARRYLQGETQAEIARSLGLSQPQISYDLKLIRQSWQSSRSQSMTGRIDQKVAELGLVKNEAWKAWESSKTVKETVTVESGSSGDKGAWEKQTVKREVLFGHPAYLSMVISCIEKQSVLLQLPTALKYEDINAAIARVAQSGYEVRELDEDADEADTRSESV